MEKDETKSLMPRLSEPVERIPSGARAAEGERGGVQPQDDLKQRFVFVS